MTTEDKKSTKVGAVEAVSLILSLTQVASQAILAASELSLMVQKARAEGRDLTDAELDQFRNSAVAAGDRLRTMA